MSKQTYFKAISEKVSMIDGAKSKLNALRLDVTRMDNRIETLKQQMDESPTYEVAQELGGLEQGKESFDRSLSKHEEEYQKLLKSNNEGLKNAALQAIRVEVSNDPKLTENIDELAATIKNLIEVSDRVGKDFYNKQQEVMDEINDLGADEYIDRSYGSYYPDPYFRPKNLPEQVIKQLDSY